MDLRSAYRALIQALLPSGPAWPREDGANLTLLTDALAEEPARLDARAANLVAEADPRETLEMLGAWERAYGLPDPCTAAAVSIRDRQVTLTAKVTGEGGQRPADFIAVAEALGFVAEVEEYAATRAGFRVGDRAASPAWAHVWRLDLFVDEEAGPGAAGDTVRFRAGSRAGERLSAFGSRDVECLVARDRPAHSIVHFAYPTLPEPLLRFDFLTAAL